MKCPLAAVAAVCATCALEQIDPECLKEECAWWLPGNKACAVMAGAALLDDCLTILQEVAKHDNRG